MASLPKLNTDGAGITQEDAVRILTAFCSTYPDLQANFEGIARSAREASETMQGLSEHLPEGTTPRPEVRDMPQDTP